MGDILAAIEAHPGLAGYVQALGSLFALVVAIGIPIWQRRSVERAAGWALHPVLEDCFWALHAAADDEPEFDFSRSDPNSTEVSQRLSRAAARLDRVSLYEFKTRCALGIRELQSQMPVAVVVANARAQDSDAAHGFDLEGHYEAIYRLMLEILHLTHTGRSQDWVAHLQHKVDLIDQWRRDNPLKIRRMNGKGRSESTIERVWRLLWFRLHWLRLAPR